MGIVLGIREEYFSSIDVRRTERIRNNRTLEHRGPGLGVVRPFQPLGPGYVGLEPGSPGNDCRFLNQFGVLVPDIESSGPEVSTWDKLYTFPVKYTGKNRPVTPPL